MTQIERIMFVSLGALLSVALPMNAQAAPQFSSAPEPSRSSAIANSSMGELLDAVAEASVARSADDGSQYVVEVTLEGIQVDAQPCPGAGEDLLDSGDL